MDKINKWEKGNTLLTVESRLVNPEATKELENQHLVVTIVTVVSGKNLKWMLKSVSKYITNRTFTWSQSIS